MKFVSRYLSKYKVQAILAPLFKMLEAVFELLVPLVMASIINEGIAAKDTHYIIAMSGVLVCLAVVGLCFSITAQYFSAKAAVYTSAEIRSDLLKKILSLSARTREKIGEEALTTRMTSDINQIQSGINMVLRLFLRSPFIVAGAIIMACFVDRKATVIFLAVVAVLSLIVYLIMKYTLPKYRLLQKKLEGVLHATGENLTGARVIRAFCIAEEEKTDFEAKTAGLYGLQMKTGNVSALLNPVTYVVVNLGVVALIYFSSLRVNSGAILQGDLVALINYMSQILVELVKLANLIALLMKAFPSADRVEEIINLESDERQHLEEQQISGKTIKLDNVKFKYNNSEDYDIDGISVEIPAGSTLGIIGGTGSGKSTLLKLLNHTYDVSSGLVSIDGVDVKAIPDEKLQKLFGFVPQKAALFRGTVRSNLCIKNENASEEELKQALITAQALDFVMDKENGLDAIVSQKGGNFSGGQKQRLTIARALVGRPDILVLDDSASALDLSTEAKLKKAISELEWKPTVIIVSQRASSVLACDNILVLEDGKCQGQGKHEDLLKNCQTYEEIYYCQFPREEAVNE